MVLATSCLDTLDTHPVGTFDEATVWGSYTTADAFVNGTYASVIHGTWAGSGSAIHWESRTANSVRIDQVGGGIDGWTLETTLNNTSDLGANQSSRLRRCNLIIDNATKSEVLTDGEKAKLIAEGKFLRAMVFYDQARKMGRFLPIMQSYTQADTAKAKELKMTASVDESYKIIIKDFQDAITGLPETAPSGRATKYAAQLMLSEACLQAYAYTKDKSYLNTCISAATNVIDNKGENLTTNYEGMFNETDMYNSEILFAYYYSEKNKKITSWDEVMLVAPNCGASEQQNFLSDGPYNDRFGGWGIFWPTQQMVDQYLAIDDATGEALPWWETSQWKNNVEEKDPTTITKVAQMDQITCKDGQLRRYPSDQDLKMVNNAYPNIGRYSVLKAGSEKNISELMYSNRDARFDANIVRDGSTWFGLQYFTNLTGNFAMGCRSKEDGGWYDTCTGYYWRKNTPTTSSSGKFNNGTYYSMHYCIARVGEAYLNRAEAYLYLGQYENAVADFNKTRTKHGNLPAAEYTTPEKAWKDYIRERNCEMCDEAGDLYFSYLRWGKEGGAANEGRAAGEVIEYLNQPTYKIEISRDRKSMLTCQTTLINAANRVFTTRRYLFPIAQSFLDTREAYGLDHEQNPGW